MLERLREAEVLAERLNDDRRRGRVGAFVTMVRNDLGELDDALVTGTRALEVAGRLGDVRLGILITSYLEKAHYYRGEYERVVELATGNLAALRADWVSEYLGLAVPPSVLDRSYLAMSLAQLGRFAEAAEYEAEAIRLAEPTQHAYTIGWAHFAAGTLRLLKGDWPKARTLIEHWIAVVRTRNVVLQLPAAVASSAWALAQLGEASEALDRLREGEPLLEGQTARGLFALSRLGLPLAGSRLLCCSADLTRRGAWPTARSNPLRVSPGSRPMRCTCSATSRPIPTGSTPSAARPTTARRWRSPSRSACARSSPTATSASASSTGARASASRRREHLTTATTMYREMDMRFWLEKAEAELGESSDDACGATSVPCWHPRPSGRAVRRRGTAAGDRVRPEPVDRGRAAHRRRIPPRPEGDGLRRGPERRDRVPFRGG